MQPSKLSISDLFQQREQYLVPLFQRGYVWTLTDQIYPLWEDIADRVAALAEHRENAAVFRPVLDPDDALRQPVGQRLVHDQLGWRLVLDREIRRAAADIPRTRRRGRIARAGGRDPVRFLGNRSIR